MSGGYPNPGGHVLYFDNGAGRNAIVVRSAGSQLDLASYKNGGIEIHQNIPHGNADTKQEKGVIRYWLTPSESVRQRERYWKSAARHLPKGDRQ